MKKDILMNKKVRVCIVGHFGGNKHFVDGQTVKTKEIHKLLLNDGDFEIRTVDTYDYKKNRINLLVQCMKSLRECDCVVLIVASNGAKVLVPLFVILNTFKRRKICYLAIGSWLDVRLKKNCLLRYFFKRMNIIFVETKELYLNLRKMSFKNIQIMYNFKHIKEYEIKEPRVDNSFCIFSRIVPEKGVEDAVDAINRLNDEGISCSLHIYGPVEKRYEKEFERIKRDNKKYIKYHGIVESENSQQFISKYWMLLFPTRYQKEGLPGTLIDSYYSYTPVIASKWASADEFVPENVGYVYKFADRDELYSTMKYCLFNKKEVEKKRGEARKFALNFTSENAVDPLIKYLKGDDK